jgi:hypothetical protein
MYMQYMTHMHASVHVCAVCNAFINASMYHCMYMQYMQVHVSVDIYAVYEMHASMHACISACICSVCRYAVHVSMLACQVYAYMYIYAVHMYIYAVPVSDACICSLCNMLVFAVHMGSACNTYSTSRVGMVTQHHISRTQSRSEIQSRSITQSRAQSSKYATYATRSQQVRSQQVHRTTENLFCYLEVDPLVATPLGVKCT